MKKLSKIIIHILIVLTLCIPLSSCCPSSCTDEWMNPCYQPGTYWESTDSTISFRVWDENDSDPYYVRSEQRRARGGGIRFDGRGTIMCGEEIYEVLVVGTAPHTGIAFFSVDVLNVTLETIMLQHEQGDMSDEEYKAKMEDLFLLKEDEYCLAFLSARFINSRRTIGTVESKSYYLSFEPTPLFDAGVEFDLRRID